MLDLDIQIIKTTTPKDKPTDESTLGFGKLFTDHMFIVEYTEGIGWHDRWPDGSHHPGWREGYHRPHGPPG